MTAGVHVYEDDILEVIYQPIAYSCQDLTVNQR